MPILNSAHKMQAEAAAWRQWLHERPEIGFDLTQTEAFVAGKLEAFGCDEIVRGVGGSGIVAVIRGRLGDGPTIGLRSDMDALPMLEDSSIPHASHEPGKMHACGHDGHMAMLLGAAKHLAESRNFAGSVAVVFQPAEEIGQGALAMLGDGLIERFGISRMFGMHNMPGIPAGQFAMRHGAIMAAVAKFTIRIAGRGGHAARPHFTIDPIVTGAQIIDALQTIVARQADPVASLVVTVTRVIAGTAYNIIPETIEIWGTTRALDMDDAAMAQRRIREICAGLATASGAQIEVDYDQAHPVTFNTPEEADFVAGIARDIAGTVDADVRPVMAGEDFSHMLNARPGALVFIGNGDTPGLHHPAYDFDDEIIPAGISYWVRLVEAALTPPARTPEPHR
ncbi:M20 aminoacylase family protein [Mesorhizobium sp. CAU 1741]|uniref:M20 aminoacylase family protein n=1 Tax=Mesorhizobium sp. CAU 1741 TaxID=3140366 RepID=UPI00325BEEB7